tara:strand:- start:834 stop:1496 length:663 start_codon:yes stop_codon:yes gene_type:complete
MKSKNYYELNKRIHSILLNPYMNIEDFEINCNLIKKYKIKNISTSLIFLKPLRDVFSQQGLKINTFISYPFGDIPMDFIKNFIYYAKDNGADGIEYTPKFFSLSKNDEDNFAKDIEHILNIGLPTTLIFNEKKLHPEIFLQALKISIEVGIVNFQFGDGFGPPIEIIDIEKIIEFLGKHYFIKIVGGIKNLKQVINILDKGVDCVGSSNFHNIFMEIEKS